MDFYVVNYIFIHLQWQFAQKKWWKVSKMKKSSQNHEKFSKRVFTKHIFCGKLWEKFVVRRSLQFDEKKISLSIAFLSFDCKTGKREIHSSANTCGRKKRYEKWKKLVLLTWVRTRRDLSSWICSQTDITWSWMS